MEKFLDFSFQDYFYSNDTAGGNEITAAIMLTVGL